MYEQPLDVGIAYSRLDIPDRTLSDEMVIEIYNIRVSRNCSIRVYLLLTDGK